MLSRTQRFSFRLSGPRRNGRPRRACGPAGVRRRPSSALSPPSRRNWSRGPRSCDEALKKRPRSIGRELLRRARAARPAPRSRGRSRTSERVGALAPTVCRKLLRVQLGRLRRTSSMGPPSGRSRSRGSLRRGAKRRQGRFVDVRSARGSRLRPSAHRGSERAADGRPSRERGRRPVVRRGLRRRGARGHGRELDPGEDAGAPAARASRRASRIGSPARTARTSSRRRSPCWSELEAGREEHKSFSLAAEYVGEPLAGVLKVAAAIPLGYVTSYGNIAKASGAEARDVGKVMASNPLYPIVPCHRVVGADLSLVGYAGSKGRRPSAPSSPGCRGKPGGSRRSRTCWSRAGLSGSTRSNGPSRTPGSTGRARTGSGRSSIRLSPSA